MTTPTIRGLNADVIQHLIDHPAEFNELKDGFLIEVECTLYGDNQPDVRASIKDTLAANMVLGNAMLMEATTALGKQNVVFGLGHALAYLLNQWAPQDQFDETRQQLIQIIMADHAPDANGQSTVKVGAVQ